MANATQPSIKASKFFAAPAREVFTLSEENFDTLQMFKDTIAETVALLVERNVELQFQHKSFLRGDVWSIDINKLSKLCASLSCRLVQTGNRNNEYLWRIVPRTVVVSSATMF